MDVLVGALERSLVEIELLEAARADNDERVGALGLHVVELTAAERERTLALPHAIECTAAALHLRGVVDHLRAERGDELLDLGRVERIVPADRRLRAQEVAAVVDGHAHTRKRLGDPGRKRTRANGVGKPFGEVHDVERAVVAEILGSKALVDALATAPVTREVARSFLEGGVAAVARRHDTETRALDDREVACRGGVEGVLVVRLHEGPLGATGVTREFVHDSAEVLEDHARRLLDEGEPRGDGASPEDRELPHRPPTSIARKTKNAHPDRLLVRVSVIARLFDSARR